MNSKFKTLAQRAPVDPRALAEIHGALMTIERCRRCGALGSAYYSGEGWGFSPRGRCGDPVRCGEKANLSGGAFALIKGGRHD